MSEKSSCIEIRFSGRSLTYKVLFVLVAIVYVLQLTLYFYTSPTIGNGYPKRHNSLLYSRANVNLHASGHSSAVNNLDSVTKSNKHANFGNHSVVQPLAPPIVLPLPPLKENVTVQENSGECSDYWCTSYLDKSSLLNFQLCVSLVELENPHPLNAAPQRCRFRRSKEHDPVALVSVPGSGNTWLRGLLEMATGVCTGSIYCDPPLVAGGFVGELVHDGSVLVIKTHTSDAQWKGVRFPKRNIDDAFYSSAIVLVRNPFDTFVSERHRLLLRSQAEKNYNEKIPSKDLSHVDKVGLEYFSNKSDWNEFVKNLTARWTKTLLEWVSSDHPVMLTRFEDIQKNTIHEVGRILKFLKFPYEPIELTKKLVDGFNAFKRPHERHPDRLQYYTFSQMNSIIRAVTNTAKELEKRGFGLFVKDYV